MRNSKSHRFYSKPQKVDQVLRHALKAYKLDHKLIQYTFVKHWPEIVGQELTEVCQPAGIKGECLFVSVPSSVWAQELSFQKNVILGRLKPYLQKDQFISDLQFRVDS